MILYPFGMLMPGRTYQAGSGSYRYSINGQEKTPEIAPNTTTALFWEYDSRIGRRWNVDPKPNRALSVFSVFANNPIAYFDIKGDTLNIPNNPQEMAKSAADIHSLLMNQSNKQFINIGTDGSITLKGDKIQLQRAISTDNGLGLLNTLINDKNHFYYSASARSAHKEVDMTTGIEDPKTYVSNLYSTYPIGSTISHDKTAQPSTTGNYIVSDMNLVITNLAFTVSGQETQNKKDVPAGTYYKGDFSTRYEGAVFIAPGKFYNLGNGGTRIELPRQSIVFHELWENYFRVTGVNGSYLYQDAHQAAQDMENPFHDVLGGIYRNKKPGETPKFFDVQ